MLIAQVTLEIFKQGLAAGFAYSEGKRYGRYDQLGVGYGGEPHGRYTVLEIEEQLTGHLQGQAGLARAARPGQGEHAYLRIAQHVAALVHLLPAPDKGSGTHRQVVRAAL